MDASLLQVMARLFHNVNLGRDGILDLVRLLDMANIVTGYFENGRRDALFQLMKGLQDRLIVTEAKANEEHESGPPKKRLRTKPKACSNTRLPPGPQITVPGFRGITRYASEDDAPGLYELSQQVEPFVISGGISKWPAFCDSTRQWKDRSYLLRQAGEGRIVPVEIGSSYTADGWTQTMMDFSEFLDKIDWNVPKESHLGKEACKNPQIVYLAQHDLFQQFPSLIPDILIPDYVFASPAAPAHYPEYNPPNNTAGYTMNAWIGPQGTYSPAHTDPFFNCYGERSMNVETADVRS